MFVRLSFYSVLVLAVLAAAAPNAYDKRWGQSSTTDKPAPTTTDKPTPTTTSQPASSTTSKPIGTTSSKSVPTTTSQPTPTTTSKPVTTTTSLSVSTPATTISVSPPASTATMPAGSCATGSLQCCNSVQTANSASADIIMTLLGIILDDLNVLVGLTCSPIDVVGVGSGTSCSSSPVCCEDNSLGGLISIGCVPVQL